MGTTGTWFSMAMKKAPFLNGSMPSLVRLRVPSGKNQIRPCKEHRNRNSHDDNVDEKQGEF